MEPVTYIRMCWKKINACYDPATLCTLASYIAYIWLGMYASFELEPLRIIAPACVER